MTRSELFKSDIDNLKRNVYVYRAMQAAIVLSAVVLPTTALIAPNQDIETKLAELGIGALAGGAALYMSKERKQIEGEFQTYLELQREHVRKSIKLENGYNTAIQEIKAEVNLANAINHLDTYEARRRYGQKYQVAELIYDTTIDSEVIESSTDNESKWLSSPFVYKQLDAANEEVATGDWILRIVQESIKEQSKRNHQHIIINAPTQSGKSTLSACIIGLLCKLNNNTQTLVIDPKDSDTNWLVPVSYSGYDKAFTGLKHAINILDERKQLIKQAKEQGQDKPNFERVLIICDEWNSIYGGGKGYADVISSDQADQMLSIVKRLLNESAFANMQLILIGQSPLSGDNGLSRPIMENATRICLNKTCIRWLQDKDFPDSDLKLPLKRQINTWLKQQKRCALIVPMVGEPYCALVPEIDLNFFSQAEHVEEFEEVEGEQTSEIIETTKHVEAKQPTYDANLLNLIVSWYYETQAKFGHPPNDATLKQAWYEITNQELTEQALNYLREFIESKKP